MITRFERSKFDFLAGDEIPDHVDAAPSALGPDGRDSRLWHVIFIDGHDLTSHPMAENLRSFADAVVLQAAGIRHIERTDGPLIPGLDNVVIDTPRFE